MTTKFYLRLTDLASEPERKDKPARRGRYPVSTGTIWRWIAEGKFPEPIKLVGTTCWPVEVIEAWEQQQAAVPAAADEQRKAAAAASVAARRARREQEMA